eukprot:gene4997-34781_t
MLSSKARHFVPHTAQAASNCAIRLTVRPLVLRPPTVGCREVSTSGVCRAAQSGSSADQGGDYASVISALPAVRLVQGAFTLVQTYIEKMRSGIFHHFGGTGSPEMQGMRGQIKSMAHGMRMLALVVPLARVSTESLTAVYARTFERAAFGFAKMYLFCLFMRVLLSWFPGIDWNAQPWTFLRLITEPYLQIYRGILPPLFGQLDFTPLFGFLILQDVVEVMAPSFTLGLHDHDTSTRWTTSDVIPDAGARQGPPRTLPEETTALSSKITDCRVIGIEMSNFKCYRDKVLIAPLSGFTCIVGPNGCGKSVTITMKGYDTASCGDVVFSIKRRLRKIGRGGETKSETWISIEEQAKSNLGHEGSNQNISGPSWRPMKQAEQQQLLQRFGIQMQAIDRFIVTQSHQVAAVHDPNIMVQHLELLLGTSSYAGKIGGLEEHIRSANVVLTDLEDTIHSLQIKRQDLAPDVEAWKNYEGKQLVFDEQKHKFLTSKINLIQKQSLSCAEQVSEADRQHADFAARADAQGGELKESTAEKAALSKRLSTAELRLATCTKKFELYGAQLMKAAGAVTAAEEAQTLEEKEVKRLEARLKMLGAKKEKTEAAEVQGASLVAELKEEGTTIRREVADLREKFAKLQACETNLSRASQASRQAKIKDQEFEQKELKRLLQSMEKLRKEEFALKVDINTIEKFILEQDKRPGELKASLANKKAAMEAMGSEARASKLCFDAAKQEVIQTHVQAQLARSSMKDWTDGHPTASRAGPGGRQALLSAGFAGPVQKFDAALLKLMKQSDVQGSTRIFGRICNSVVLTDASMSVPVNAVLRELLNLSTTVLVSDRETAYAAVNFFRQAHAGFITCRILSEIHENQQQCPGAKKGMIPLVSTVEAGPEAKAVAPMLASLLQGWYLVHERQTAQAEVNVLDQTVGALTTVSIYSIQLRSRGGFVTMAGEVFKTDGEIVATIGAGRSSELGTHHIGMEVQSICTDVVGLDDETTRKKPGIYQAEAKHQQKETTKKLKILEEAEEACGSAQKECKRWEKELCSTEVKLRQLQDDYDATQQALASLKNYPKDGSREARDAKSKKLSRVQEQLGEVLCKVPSLRGRPLSARQRKR